MKNVHIESRPVIRYTAIVRGHDRDKASPFCRGRHGDHIRTLRRGCDRRTISGDVQTIQELFERVATANCVTGTPGNCVAGYSSIDISSSLLSCASTCVSGTNMIDVHVNRSNEHSRAPVRARACIERAAATSRGKTRGNSSRNRDEKPFQAVATAFIV